jgi:hypothetical protein
MKITCACGHLIVDGTDQLPHKAHLIPDQDYFGFLNGIDAVIDDVHAGRITPHDAYMAVRHAHASRLTWQCSKCGRLYVDDRQHKLNIYVPASTQDSKEILRSRD